MEYVVFELSIIIISTAILCFIAEIAKQPLIVAYIVAGLIVGPNGLNLIHANGIFTALSQIGIVLLLYLIGLELRPNKFTDTILKSLKVSGWATALITPLGILIGFVSGLGLIESIYLTIALLFSSTVVVIKNMHDERGVSEEIMESCIGILLIQDLMAILALIIVNSLSTGSGIHLLDALLFFSGGIFFISAAFIIQKFLIRRVVKKILDRTDLVFLIGLAWCFLLAEFAELIQLSREIGGFIAGLSLTNLPAYKLRIFIFKSETIRDFFMILFFFVLGANLRFEGLENYTLAISLALGFTLFIKPLIFYFGARQSNYKKEESKEIGLRLGQNSEFSIIIAMVAVGSGHISSSFAMAIQFILFLSIVLSNYVLRFYPYRK